MRDEELKCDCNFFYDSIPGEITLYMSQNAIRTYHKYVSWVSLIGESVVIRTFAFRRDKKNLLEWTEVERKCTDYNKKYAVRKNIYLTSMSGYKAVYKTETHTSSSWYGYSYYYFSESDFNVWTTENIMNLYAPVINYERIFDTDRYKYCGYSGKGDLFKYLMLYDEEPMVEYFGKLGIVPTKALINKAKKDKQFITFMRSCADEINHYGPQATLYAYKNNIPIVTAAGVLYEKKKAEKLTNFEGIKNSPVDRVKLYKWIMENGISFYSYGDYFKAIYHLGLDLNDTKNVYPHNFQRMHDLRINEYDALKAKLDRKAKEDMKKNFIKNALKWEETVISDENYMIIIPHKVSDLVTEGKELHHCVGRMGYDAKMANGKCIIAFVRNIADPDTPFVTCEYLFDGKKISQCYADHDSRPAADVIEFANRWGQNVTKMLKKGAIA